MLKIVMIAILLVAAIVAPKIVRWCVLYDQDLEKKRWSESDAEFIKRVEETKKRAKKYSNLATKIAWPTAGILSLLLLAWATVRIVPTGTVGVKTSFGVVSGRASEGFNIIAPWEEIIPMDTKIQKQSFTDLTASTKDAQSITNINIDVNYNLNPEKADQVFSTVGEEYQDKLIAPLLTQFIKDRLALYNAESLVTERNKIVDDITMQLQENLKGYGVNIVAVSLMNYDFSADFSSALERKAVAEKEIETAKNNQEKAKVEAETNRIKTEQLTDAVLMEKLIDAIKNGTGTYIIDTSNLSISVR